MTKHKRIQELAAPGILATREIADIIVKEMGGPCSAAYVRVCARQRTCQMSASDRRYIVKFCAEHGITPDGFQKRRRRTADVDYWERSKKYMRDYYYRKKAERELRA